MISNVPELLKPLFVCMGVVKGNDVIDICYSPDLSHLNEDEQHVWGYHWNGLSLVIFPTQHVWRVPKPGVMEVTIFYDQILYHPPAQYKPHPISCSMHEFKTQRTRNSNTTHTYCTSGSFFITWQKLTVGLQSSTAHT